jgi:hypothetical protein
MMWLAVCASRLVEIQRSHGNRQRRYCELLSVILLPGGGNLRNVCDALPKPDR